MYSALHSHPFFLMLLLSSVVLYPCIDLSIKRWNSKYFQNSLIWFKSFSDLYLVYSDILHLQVTRVIFCSVGYYLPKCLPEGLAYILLILQCLACPGRGSGPKEQRGEHFILSNVNYFPFELQIEFILYLFLTLYFNLVFLYAAIYIYIKKNECAAQRTFYMVNCDIFLSTRLDCWIIVFQAKFFITITFLGGLPGFSVVILQHGLLLS